MKTFLLSLALLCVTLASFSQLPCVKYYSVKNLGGGDCQTAGTGPNKYYPGYLTATSNANYSPTGKFTVYFDGSIPAGVSAPEIVSVTPDISPLPLSTAFDYKYAAYNDNSSAARTAVTYCYYGSASNQNIFNGAKEPKLIFAIKYVTIITTNQQCGGVTEVPSTLPVSLKAFTAIRSNQSVVLNWQTVMEENNSGFAVQVKTGNQDWKDVAFVASKAHSGSSNSELSYQYVDANNTKEISLYRLKQIDIAGKVSYSEIKSVRGQDQQITILSVFPNPAKTYFSIMFPDETALYDLQIIDATGRMVKQFSSVKSNKSITDLKPGQYLIIAVNKESNTKLSGKVMIQ
jgi:hypothetical protein